jgi:class 3 adenylate cyclase
MDAVATERRLAAISGADIVGYSRLIETDEAGTLASIRRLRAEVIAPLLATHHGGFVKLMGDGAIVDSAWWSMRSPARWRCRKRRWRCRKAAAAQKDLLVDRRIVFRIGINLGDVVSRGDDILGDGVNVASRLFVQRLAITGRRCPLLALCGSGSDPDRLPAISPKPTLLSNRATCL